MDTHKQKGKSTSQIPGAAIARHLKQACSRKPVYVKCGAHEPDHTEDMCINNLNWSNCNESHGANSKLCKIRGKEIS